jgi:hypothetical protein
MGSGHPTDRQRPLPAVTNGSVSGVAFSPDGKLQATDGTVRMWQMPLFANPYAALCGNVGPLAKGRLGVLRPG